MILCLQSNDNCQLQYLLSLFSVYNRYNLIFSVVLNTRTMSSSTGSHGHWTPAGPVNDEERIIINVGGVRHETYKRTLLSIPGSRLANLVSDSGAASKTDPPDFFFDRSAEAFSHILNYYRTGKLHYPPGVCGPLFEEELAYWGISANDVESCCWTDFRRHRDAEAELSRFEPDEPPAAQGHARGGCMPKAWALFDDPDSSVAAKVCSPNLGRFCRQSWPMCISPTEDGC